MSRKRCSREMAATGKKVRAEHTQLLLRGERDMGVNKIYRGVVMVAVMAILVSSAQAAITIQVAEEVQNGMVVIKGKGAARGASITWEGGLVTTANHGNGSFSFLGELPDDCTGVLSDGNETISIEVSGCISVTAGLAPAPLAKTGQTVSIAAGDDGALQKGVAWPNPRFTDNANGTVTDNLTGLIWLKDANCLRGIRGWFAALSDANNVANGVCGLSDGSRAGDWRLPNRNELTSLLDLNKRNPALPSGHPFTDFQAAKYWTSTANSPGSVWRVDFLDAAVTDGTTANFWFVTFVRDGR